MNENEQEMNASLNAGENQAMDLDADLLQAMEEFEALYEDESVVQVSPTPIQNVGQAPVQQTPVQEMPVEPAPVQQTPVQEMPVEPAPVQEVPAQETPVEQVPIEQPLVQEMPVQEVPAQETPVEQVPIEQPLVQEMPVQEVPVQEVSVHEAPAQEPSVEITDFSVNEPYVAKTNATGLDTSKKSKKSTSKKNAFPIVILALISIALVVGIAYVVKTQIGKIKKDKKEDTQEVVVETTEEVTTEETTELEYWFQDKTPCVPVMTENTISLSPADLSVFTQAANEEAEGVPQEDRIDPWAAVTMYLDPVEGSINNTSPGVLEETKQLTSTYMVLVDVDTNEIIAERDCEKVVVPASMTKILTVITAREFIDESNLDDEFTITSEIIAEAQNSGLSAVGFLPGDTVTVRDMLYGTIVCSGADAAMGLAEYCAGSQEAFVERMNQNVERLGLSDTAHFTNVVGKYDEDLHCTMTDMATIISIAMQDDLLRDVMSKRIYQTDIKYPDEEINMPDGLVISNWFLRRIEDKEMAGNVIGAKTGFVNQSGFCAASYYEANNGKRYICVTGNASSSWRAIYDHVGVYRSLTPQ